MATHRKVAFLDGEYYHVFNRGLDRRVTFSNKREYDRAVELLTFYQYCTIPLRYSRYSLLNTELRKQNLDRMKESGKCIEVVAYSLMPNHFHLLLRQRKEKGIAAYVSNFMNAYTKYFNTRHERIGPLFEGSFKAVYVQTDEQFVHLTRYIHLNPVVSSIIYPQDLASFPWSSYKAYAENQSSNLIESRTITMIRTMVPDYEQFISDQIAYGRELEKIKHLLFEK